MDEYPDGGFTAHPPQPEESAARRSFDGLIAFFRELFESVLIAGLLFLAINAVSTRIYVESISMQPTLYERDQVFVNRLAYRLGTPERKDVVVFMPPLSADNEPYIKRIIGLPGDHIQIMDGRVYINGTPLEEPYLKAPPAYQGDWTVPDGMLFVLGDNRNNSFDSHAWGMVPLDAVLGKAEAVYWPVAHWKMLSPATASAAGP